MTHAAHRIRPATTHFAPAAYATDDELHELVQICNQSHVTQVILESVACFVMILNSQRQIIASNPRVLTALNVLKPDCLLGLRPGEAFHCIHAPDAPHGCGTSQHCSTCGAVISILSSQTLNHAVQDECLMTVKLGDHFEAHEFSVKATPIYVRGHQLTIFMLHDISDTKRRQALEHVFMHDLLNIVTGLNGWVSLLSQKSQNVEIITDKISQISRHLTHEIQNQRMLLEAEQDELRTTLATVTVEDMFTSLRSIFSGYTADMALRLDIVPENSNTRLQTSPQLLLRILANMVINALEATRSPERVTLWFERRNGAPCFVVHNPGEISDSIKLQIFRRSFSTKQGRGRGLGTYSMKLFGEQYLGGRVAFTSTTNEGTRFSITLPTIN